MVPGQLRAWILLSLLHLNELRLFLIKKNEKNIGNDYNLLDNQRETYLEDLKREEEKFKESEIINNGINDSLSSNTTSKPSKQRFIETIQIKRKNNNKQKRTTYGTTEK